MGTDKDSKEPIDYLQKEGIHRIIGLGLMFLCLSLPSFGQRWAVKTNILSDVTTTLNLGVETKLSPKLTLDVPLSYHPWKLSSKTYYKHALLSPELRYWTCVPFSGWFVGVHGMAGIFNFSGIDWMRFESGYRYQGYMAGAGLSCGYDWIISPRFNLELSLGIGYLHHWYDAYQCDYCERKVGSNLRCGTIVPSRVSLSFTYILK